MTHGPLANEGNSYDKGMVIIGDRYWVMMWQENLWGVKGHKDIPGPHYVMAIVFDRWAISSPRCVVEDYIYIYIYI